MTADADNRFAAVRLPSGAGGDIVRIGANPTLLLGSDVPIALGQDGNLYFPSHGAGTPLQILKFLPTGQTSILASVPAATARGPLRDLNGLAAGPDGSLFYTEDDAIRRISREGRVSTVLAMANCASVPGKGATRGPMLRGLAVDAVGTTYVAATGCGAVLKVTPAGQVAALPQGANAWPPTGIALFGRDVYVLEFQDANSDDRQAMLPRVRKIAADGTTGVVAIVTRHAAVNDRF
jgi:sugar lactone lactonase YvrE